MKKEEREDEWNCILSSKTNLSCIFVSLELSHVTDQIFVGGWHHILSRDDGQARDERHRNLKWNGFSFSIKHLVAFGI
jgi:hypothetical protein